MNWNLIYHPAVKDEDIAKLDNASKERLRKAIETRLIVAPEKYGKPLRKTLKGYWKFRVSDYRVVFKILDDKTLLILGIRHRRDIYKVTVERLK